MKTWNPEKYAECSVCKVQRKVSLLLDGKCRDQISCATLAENVRRLAPPHIAVDQAKPDADATLVIITEILRKP